LLQLLGQIADPAGAARVIDAAMGPDAPAGSALKALWQVSHDHPNLAWKRALPYVERADSPVDPQMKMILIPMIASVSSEQGRIKDLQAYADQHIPASARQRVTSAIASINLNAKFKSERLPEIDEWLAAKTTR
jgi:aminopeptidase N